jgi:hypothetical protein
VGGWAAGGGAPGGDGLQVVNARDARTSQMAALLDVQAEFNHAAQMGAVVL